MNPSNKMLELGMMVYVYNPSEQETEVRESLQIKENYELQSELKIIPNSELW